MKVRWRNIVLLWGLFIKQLVLIPHSIMELWKWNIDIYWRFPEHYFSNQNYQNSFAGNVFFVLSTSSIGHHYKLCISSVLMKICLTLLLVSITLELLDAYVLSLLLNNTDLNLTAKLYFICSLDTLLKRKHIRYLTLTH